LRQAAAAKKQGNRLLNKNKENVLYRPEAMAHGHGHGLGARHIRGAGKKKSTDPPVHLLNPRPTHPPPDFFSLAFLFSAFLGVSRQGEFKTP
jgi:hypothetical protein